MKKLLLSALILFAIAAAFFGGRWIERASYGYHYRVLEDKQIKGAVAPLHWKAVEEWVGSSVMEPETTIIEVDGRAIYKAKRTFQESSPRAQSVRVNNGLIEWEDGQYAYSLKMQSVPQNPPSQIPLSP